MSIIMWAVIAIAIIIAVVLLTPISLHAQGCLAEKKNFRGEISWAGGLTSFSMVMAESGNIFYVRLGFWRKRLHEKSSAVQKEKAKDKIKEKAKETKKTNRQGFSDIKIFFNRLLLKEVLAFLGRAHRSLNLRLCLEGEYGAGDPAVTGYLSALVGLINSSRCTLRLNPNFQELILNLCGEMSATLIPAVLIFHTIGFFFAPAVRKIWWRIIKSKIKRRV
ncbi:DUF2953 domain-containing protein [Pelotomaculum propionicicum]|uniref:DUF2953 domain-containing protein n=1 Tax=Pelotomaculum propionicicum TaxID=258475 RepID=UPI003B7A2697